MTDKRKKAMTAVGAVAMAAVIALGGTFAWQSISQQALNEAAAVVNPGGRLHDDFDGSNKDVYVENFTDAADVRRFLPVYDWTSTWNWEQAPAPTAISRKARP